MEFEAIITSIKKNFFHHRIFDFVKKLQVSNYNYQTNVTVRDANSEETLLFPMKDFVSFRKYIQSTYFMSTRLLKNDIDEVRLPQFQLGFICNTTHPLHKTLFMLCRVVHYICRG